MRADLAELWWLFTGFGLLSCAVGYTIPRYAMTGRLFFSFLGVALCCVGLGVQFL